MTLNEWLEKAKKDGVVSDSGASNVKGKEPRDILPKPIPYAQPKTGCHRPNVMQEFMDICPIVKHWMRSKRTEGAKKQMVYPFLHFCREANIMPKDFGELNKTREETLKARDMVWEVCTQLMDVGKITRALQMRKSCKAFYRFYGKGDAELPFATRAGDYHHIPLEGTEVPEFEWGTFEEAKEHFYDILSKAGGLTMRTITLLTYVAGWRVNVFSHLKWEHLEEIGVIDVDGQDVLVIKITPKIDTKQAKALTKYYSFITGEALKSRARAREYYPY